jgi:hypothetical protein
MKADEGMDKQLFLRAATALAAALLLTACSEAPKPAESKRAEAPAKTEPTGPPEAVDGSTAFYEMYKPARTWATDLLPLTLTSGEVPGIKNEDGKAGMWTAVFVSPSRGEARTFVYAVADHGSDIHKGVSARGAQAWSGATPQSRPFQITEFSVNSEAAFKTASKTAGAWLKRHPGQKVSITLASTARFPGPVWYIMWGTRKSGYLAFVSATTGMALK